MPVSTAADQVRVFSITVPAQTAITAAVTTDMNVPAADVVGIEIVIPDGHRGRTGIAIAQSGQAIIPYNAGAFIVSNNEVISWPVTGFSGFVKWQAITYNLDVYAHTFHVRFLLNIGDLLLPSSSLQPVEIPES